MFNKLTVFNQLTVFNHLSARLLSPPRLAAMVMLLLPLIVAAKPAPRPIGPDGRAQYKTVELVGVDGATFGRLVQAGFDLEKGGGGAVIAYATDEELEKLTALGTVWFEIVDTGRSGANQPPAAPDATSYHNYDQLTTKLQQVANDYPQITRLVSAGKSVQGRELWWLKITDNPDAHEDEPGFKYISTMHGDEPVGTEMCLNLIDWLTQRYGTDSRVDRLVNGVEIWIMPMMNPDGNTLSQRYNAQGVDLNRDFPDQFEDPIDDPAGRAPETQAIMNWQTGHSTVLSANFHTGEVVANYPFDGNASHTNVYAACPDDDIAIDISLDYSEDNTPMYTGNFPQGITNGADWYVVYGGMQDWNYNWRGDVEITVELNNPKWPPASVLDQRWAENRESMLSYMERALSGVRGIITDASTGLPIKGKVTIAGRGVPFYSDLNVGDYHRVLKAGNYSATFEAAGYASRTISFTVNSSRGDATRLNVALVPQPATLAYASHRIAGDGNNNGYLDAGENGSIALTLSNSGGPAGTPHGLLHSLTKYGAVTSEADWATIAAGGSGESLAPHFGVSVAANAPAGHSLAFYSDWQTAEGRSGTTDAFIVPLSAPTTADRPAADIPRPIPDNGSTISTINVPDDLQIYEVNARVDITHPFIGDLRVTLIAPDGTQARLHDRSGGSADNIHTVYDTLTKPVDDLTRFNGKSGQGNWQLKVEDLALTNRGTLTGWTLELITRPWEQKLPEVVLRGLRRQADGSVKLDWWPVGSTQSYKLYRTGDPRAAANWSDITGEDPLKTDLTFVDRSVSAAGSLTCWLVTGVGHGGEGEWGHYDR